MDSVKINKSHICNIRDESGRVTVSQGPRPVLFRHQRSPASTLTLSRSLKPHVSSWVAFKVLSLSFHYVGSSLLSGRRKCLRPNCSSVLSSRLRFHPPVRGKHPHSCPNWPCLFDRVFSRLEAPSCV